MNDENFKNKLRNGLYSQQQIVFYIWSGAVVIHVVMICFGIALLFQGKIHDGSLTTVAGVLSQMSVGGFAKYNLSRLEKQIKGLM